MSKFMEAAKAAGQLGAARPVATVVEDLGGFKYHLPGIVTKVLHRIKGDGNEMALAIIEVTVPEAQQCGWKAYPRYRREEAEYEATNDLPAHGEIVVTVPITKPLTRDGELKDAVDRVLSHGLSVEGIAIKAEVWFERHATEDRNTVNLGMPVSTEKEVTE